MAEEAPQRYKIIFRGEFVGSMTQEEVGRNLQERLKFSEAALTRLFSGKPMILKSDLDEATANRYAQALWAAGARCNVEPMVGPPPIELGRPLPTKAPAPVSEMICPRCHQHQPEAEVCAGCGVVIAKARQRQEEATVASWRGGSAAPPVPPVAPPIASSEPEVPLPAVSGVMTRRVVQAMVGTSLWVRLVAVLMFLSMGLGIAGSLVAFLVGPRRGLPFALPTALIQILICALYLIPAVYLYRYAGAIGAFLKAGAVAELETALECQKSFWKFVGILTLSMVGLALIGIIVAILIPLLLSRT